MEREDTNTVPARYARYRPRSGWGRRRRSVHHGRSEFARRRGWKLLLMSERLDESVDLRPQRVRQLPGLLESASRRLRFDGSRPSPFSESPHRSHLRRKRRSPSDSDRKLALGSWSPLTPAETQGSLRPEPPCHLT